MQLASAGQRGPRGARDRLLGRILGLLGFCAGVLILPHRIAALGTAAWYEGSLGSQERLARRVARWIDDDSTARAFSTGSPRFDSEWRFGTYQMAALGFGQLALEHPEARDAQRGRMERAIDRMLSADGQRFDTEAWGRDALSTLDGTDAHAAYLGYTNLVLALHRSLWPDSRYAGTNDAITAALERRYAASEIRMLETYPGEIYPLDNAAAIASVALHARATRREVPPLVREWVDLTRRKYVHAETGLLYQAVSAGGAPADAPRGSGTALGAYFLSFADAELSESLHRAVQKSLARDVLGFRAVREYPDLPGMASGHGDIDSGPLVFGFSVSATGFSIGGCRIHGDKDCYEDALATAWLFGAPIYHGAEMSYVSGGPLGDAILFAMQTAPRRRG